jgi:imidazolonepropionase-like amidohydrolase
MTIRAGRVVFALAAVLASAVLLSACGAPPPSARVARPDPAPREVWIADVAVLDVAHGERIPGRDVWIEAGRIAAIEPAGSSAAPAGALVLRGSGATLVPGLVDMHGHVYANPGPPWQLAFPDPDANLHTYLYSGVTTLFDPGDPSGDAFERRASVASGEQIGPRIFTAGPLLTAPDGHPIALIRELAPAWIAWWLAPRQAVTVDSEEQANAVVDELAEQRADAVKIVIDAIPLDAPRMRPEVARAIAARARSRGLRTVAHIGTTEDAIAAAEAGVALWVHGVYKERIPDDQIGVLAGYRIPMVATVEVFDSYARAASGPRAATALEREIAPAALLDAFDPIPEDFGTGSLTSWQDLNAAAMPFRIDNVRRLRAAGVTILAGSDAQSGVFPGPGLHRELANLVRAGMTPSEAIRAATLDAARFLAASDTPDFGDVAVGQRADLLLVEGDPTRDVAALERIREVLLDGVPLARTPVTAVGE